MKVGAGAEEPESTVQTEVFIIMTTRVICPAPSPFKSLPWMISDADVGAPLVSRLTQRVSWW